MVRTATKWSVADCHQMIATGLLADRQPVSGTYAEIQTLNSGMVTPLAFPDLEIKIKRLLPES
jgi:hypothetical protein